MSFGRGGCEQGRTKDTSSVAMEVLIINWQIYFINVFIFSFVILNIKLFIFKLFDVKFFFSKSHVFCKENGCFWTHGRASFVSYFKLIQENDDLLSWDINKFLRYRTLYNSILKCAFMKRGIELTRFVLFEVLGIPRLWDESV